MKYQTYSNGPTGSLPGALLCRVSGGGAGGRHQAAGILDDKGGVNEYKIRRMEMLNFLSGVIAGILFTFIALWFIPLKSLRDSNKEQKAGLDDFNEKLISFWRQSILLQTDKNKILEEIRDKIKNGH